MVREYRTYLDDHPMYHFSLGDFIRRGRFYICLILGVVFITFVCLVVSLMPSVFNNFLVKYNNKTWCEIISSQWLASWKWNPHGPTIPCYSIVPQASHLMSGGKIKSPGAITLRGLFPLFFLSILRIVYFYMGEEG